MAALRIGQWNDEWSMEYTRNSLFIGGEWCAPSTSDVITVTSPFTEQLIGWAAASTYDDVDRTVAAARRSFTSGTGWSRWDPAQRADVLERLADSLEKRADETARLVTAENGLPYSVSSAYEGLGPPGILRYFAAVARATSVENVRPSPTGAGSTIVRREPLGVVGAIVPWNVPQTLTMFKVAPALAAGCTVVLKPAPETVLDAFQIADAAVEAGVPAGVLNIVTGGGEIGAHLVGHRDVAKVAFTGSTLVGRTISETCGRLLRPATLELGGKSAAIVLDDADLTDTVQGLAAASLLHAGQICYLGTRILAPRSRYQEVLDAVSALASYLVMGDPMDPDTFVGPLVSARQRDRVESYIQIGKGEGKLVTGGTRGQQPCGYFVEPTVFGDVSNSSRLAREEIFGPVLSVIPYRNVDDAVNIANDSDYGLGGTIWTSDEERGLEIARRVETGSIGVNTYVPDVGAPFGGVKASGLGRELGTEGLGSFVSLKSIYRAA